MKFEKAAALFFLATLCCIALFFGVSYFFAGDGEISEYENRALRSFPEFTPESLMDGRFSERLHGFFSDRIALRHILVETKAVCELLLCKRASNGIVLCEGGYLIELPSYTDESYSLLSFNLARIEALTDDLEAAEIEAHSVIIPRKADLLGEYLPTFYPRGEIAAAWERVGARHVSLLPALDGARERGWDVFYKSDHHWTASGAYFAYVELCRLLSVECLPMADFEIEELSDGFCGSLYSRSGFFFLKPESIHAPRDRDDRFVSLDGEGGSFGLYREEFLSKKDKYSVFLGGNSACIRIFDTAPSEKETILIVNDSFSLSLVPYLTEHFNIVLVDPRYYRGGISTLVDECGAKRIVFLLSLDTLLSSKLNIK